ncbi:hypothetical protein GMDG_06673 [Pseudogymnoascus destructans 20631-21]|uniref:Uncharacterized protein n=2 Tax=Pseudogymnoascus destructans TaxID=655981 RepID=L8FX31_PSED2|nr:hypothetical protein GMDG_06673 [Pseudogymnoascus destructans 20631-21]
MISSLLKEGEARVKNTLHKGYAPTSFSHNLELIFVQDNRSPASLSMKTKIVSTSDRAARLRALEPPTLLWWATAFPMRHWSGGRKISSNTFDSLLRHAPRQTAQSPSLRAVLWDDMEHLRQKHPSCEMLQDFLSAILQQDLVTDGKGIPTAIGALSQQGRYISFTGARYDCLPKLPDLLRYGIECSRKYQEETNNSTLISTALEIFLPLDPNEDEAYAVVRIGTREAWHIMQELKIVDEEPCY